QDGAVGPMLSYVDFKIRQIPFKNVAVGDTVVTTVRYTERRHYLGDGFSQTFAITPYVATLMSALLAAKGIASEYALINTAPVYQLDATPQVASFNHVILYLPEFDLYADPTAAVSFVGRLPRVDRGKPVLRAS